MLKGVTFQMPIIYDNSALQAELLIYKRYFIGYKVATTTCAVQLPNYNLYADPSPPSMPPLGAVGLFGSAFRM